MRVRIHLLSQRPPAQRVAWILPPQAVKDRGAKCPNRCGWNRVRSTRFGKPNRFYRLILFSALTMMWVTGSILPSGAFQGVPKPGEIWHEPVTGMAFVWVPGGCFEMGSPTGEAGRDPDEGPVHAVCVDGFWMGKTEVTNAQYRQFKTNHVSNDHRGFSLSADDQPVVHMSWNDAKAFATWLSGQNKGRYRFRLPTEAEWEYACRAATRAARFWGDDADKACEYGNVADLTAKREWSYWEVNNCDDGYVVTAPVGSFKPNAFGLYDMLGNVFEWSEDTYSQDAYRHHQRNNPIFTGGGSYGVIRGGCWYSWAAGVRCAGRSDHPPAGRHRDYFLGLRLVRAP